MIIEFGVAADGKKLDSGEKRGKTVRNMYIFPSDVGTTNPETRTEGRRPEQPIDRARNRYQSSRQGAFLLDEGPSDRSRGNDFPCAGIVSDAEHVRSVFSHACAPMLPLSATLRGFGLLVVYTRGFCSRQSRVRSETLSAVRSACHSTRREPMASALWVQECVIRVQRRRRAAAPPLPRGSQTASPRRYSPSRKGPVASA